MSNLVEQLPTELWEYLFLHLEFFDIVSMMRTCSEMWQRFRYNFSFWNHYHTHKYGRHLNLPLKKLGDSFRSVHTRAYGIWILAEIVIDIIYDCRYIRGVTSGECHVYGGYLRDRLARRMDFYDINVALDTRNLEDSFFIRFHTQLGYWNLTWSRAKSYDDNGWRYIIRNDYTRVIVTFLITEHRDLAIDFDVNSLYLVDRHTYGLKYSNDPLELARVIENCQKMRFSLKPIRVNSTDALMTRYQYMLRLGFNPVATEYVVPPSSFGNYN